MSELQSLLEQLADDGQSRGVWPVFAAATQRATIRRRVRRRRVALSSLAAVLAVVVGVAAIVHATSTSNSTPEIHTGPGIVTPKSAGATAAELLAGHWATIPAPPMHLTGEVTAWTGTELFVWGPVQLPETSQSPFRSGGALYDPATRTWRSVLSSEGVIEAGAGDVAVWTGDEVVIWNDSSGVLRTSPDAAAYNPATNRWRRLPAAPTIPTGTNAGMWTGRRAVFFAGDAAVAYDPATNAWARLPAATSQTGAPLLLAAAAGPGRILAWYVTKTREQLAQNTLNNHVGETTLFRYDEDTDRWTKLAASPGAVPTPEAAAWAGTRVLVRGSPHDLFSNGPAAPDVSAWYDPDTGVATRIAADDLTDLSAAGFSSVWTGAALVSLNAEAHSDPAQRGDADVYDPARDAWSRLPSAPFGCPGASLVWTGAVVVTYCAAAEPVQQSPVGGLTFVPRAAAVPAVGRATIAGTLHSVGGPAPGLGIPLRGTVTATASDGTTYDVTVGADGKFSLSVPAGTYTMTGTSPQYESGAAECQGGKAVARSGAETSGVIVACQER